MATKLEIFNLSANHLALRPILALAESTPAADAFNAYYQHALDDVLADGKWPFATVIEALSVRSDVVLGWDYTYTYPLSSAAVWNVFDESTVDNRENQDFQVVYISSTNERIICSDLQSAYVEYTYKITDPTLFSPKFTMLLSYKLAALAGNQLVDKDTGLKMVDIYNLALSEAKRLSFGEKKIKPARVSAYQSAR